MVSKKKKSLAINLKSSSASPFSSMMRVSRGRSSAAEFGEESKTSSQENNLDEEFSILSEVRSVMDDKGIVARDMKIDDSSMPRAKSYWDWVTGDNFLGGDSKPYLEQALIGIKLFSEYCPRCSDLHWMQDENHKPQEGLDGIRKHVVVLEHGVCPECGARRSTMIKQGELNFYNELAVNAGQRCVSGETQVIVDGLGYVNISSLVPESTPKDKTGFVKFEKPIQVLGYHGYSESDSIFISRKERLWEIELCNGSKLVGTPEHPVYAAIHDNEDKDDWVDISKLKVGDKLQTLMGLSTVVKSQYSDRTEYTYDLSVPEVHEYYTNDIRSHNSGKSIVVAMISTYITHRILMMQKPTEIYNVGSNQMLHGTFVALTAGQAKDTLYEPYYGYILDSPWFKKYHTLMDHYQKMYGQVFYKIKDTYIQYRHRNLLVYFAGPDKRVLRGRCLTGDTMVNTTNGFLEFEEFISDDGFTETDITIDSHRGNRKVSHLYKDESETYKLTTANGFSVEGTPEHPMLVVTENLTHKWKRLDEIESGDWIVSRTKHNSPMFGDSDLTKDEASLLAYFIANGHRNEISSNDPIVVKNLISVAKRVTGKTPTRTANDPAVRADTYYIKTSSKGCFQDWLKSKGLDSRNSLDKYIPKLVRTAPKEVLHEFLESYFECDSGINGGSCTGATHEAPIEVEVGSASEKLAKQLHTILFHGYGILGRFTKRVINDKLNPETGKFDAERVHFLITITGYDAWLFFQTFKRAKVQKYKERSWFVEKGFASDRRNIPYIRKFIFDLIEDARVSSPDGKRLRRLLCEDGTEILNSKKPKCIEHLRGKCTTHTASEYLIYSDDWEELLSIYDKVNSAKSDKLRKFIDRESHYEQVVSCEKQVGKKIVYDVTVPKGHAFTANCLASHNTRVFGSVDEIGWFDNNKDSGKVKIDAGQVYIALERSLLTCRLAEERQINMGYDEALSAYFLNISSPSSVRDKICELVRLSEGSKKMLGLHKPTWEMNPNVTRDSDIVVEAYRVNPIDAERDYGANPPLSSNPFMTARAAIEDCLREVGRNLVVTKPKIYRAKDGDKFRYAEIEKIKPTTRPSVLAIDAGLTNNSFALSCGSLVDGKPSIDLLIEIQPLPGIPLHYTLITDNVIKEVIEKRNVCVLLADRWNSVKLLQDMETYFDSLQVSKQYSVKYSDLWNLKAAIEAREISMPRMSKLKTIAEALNFNPEDYPRCFEGLPVEHMVLQMLTVQDTGKQVVKGDNLTDDLWRASVLMYWGLTNPDYAEYMVIKEAAAKGKVYIGSVRKGLENKTTSSGKSQVRGTVGGFLGVRSNRK